MGVISGLESALEAIYDIKNAGSILIIMDRSKEGVVEKFERAILNSDFDGTLRRFYLDDYKRPLKEIPEDLNQVIGELNPSLTITLFEAYSDERPMRIKLLTKLEEIGRIAHCPGITEEMLREGGPFDIDYNEMKKKAIKLKEVLKDYTEFEIITGENGEYKMTLRTDGRRWLDDLTVAERGFGNLPAGEIFIGPLEDSANGEMCAYSRAGEHLLTKPVIVTWKRGRVVKIESENKELEKLLSDEIGKIEYNDIIGELGLGFNVNADPKSKILESEKHGPHIARGPSTEFGSIYACNDHEDYLLYNATIIARNDKGEEITVYKNGVLNEELLATA